jgi:hypothetical protein
MTTDGDGAIVVEIAIDQGPGIDGQLMGGVVPEGVIGVGTEGFMGEDFVPAGGAARVGVMPEGAEDLPAFRSPLLVRRERVRVSVLG